MGYLPEMPVEVEAIRQQTIEFKGYSNAPIIADGEMRDMKNLSSDLYPTLTQRKGRGLYSDMLTRPYNILAWKEKLAYVDGKTFFYDGERKGALISEGEKILAPINNKICIFPDKICYNLISNKMETLEAHFETGTLDEGAYINVTTNTLTIPNADFSDFAFDDAVILSGFTTFPDNNISAKIVKIEANVITFPDNSFKMPDGSLETGNYREYGNIKIDRNVPDMDYLVEANNRLWGCKGNSIYSCRLGDPKNWEDYSAIANASYAVDVGTDGDFTGVTAYPTHIAFFKEDYIHRLYGNNKPSTYQIDTIRGLGLQKGCHKSIQAIDGIIYYKSREGIVAYDGTYPVLITQNFKYKYTDAAAGTDLMKYYVSMKRPDGVWDLFAYDLSKRIWHREDNTHASMFTFLHGKLIYIDDGVNKIYKVVGDDEYIQEDEHMEWYAVFGDYDEYIENKKVYSRIQMRFEMDDESEMTVSLSEDNGVWQQLCHLYTDRKRTMYLPIIPRRCDKFKLKLEGKGRTKIESIVRICREGSGI
ncbi:hypothetical protein M2140_001927 [Clostridiales Family XIII bacterium PM5-7]